MNAKPQTASALIAGAGNIGSHLAPLLARAGFGLLRVVDRDIVEENNLEKQDFQREDVGSPKALALARRLRGQFPSLRVEAYHLDLEDVPLGAFRVDVLLGALDSRRARQILVSERAWPLGVPLIDGAVGEGLLGRVQVFAPGPEAACLECTWGEADYRQLAAEYPCVPGAAVTTPATAAPACVGAVVAGLMAARCLSLLEGPAPAESRELAFDLRHNRFLEARLRRAPRCRFDHQVVREVLRIGPGAAVGDLLDAVGQRFGDRPAHVEGRHLAGNGGFTATRFLSTEALQTRRGEALAALGLGPGDGVRVRADGESVFVLVEG
jgi:adenylyltransferase/sulfurtransferase